MEPDTLSLEARIAQWMGTGEALTLEGDTKVFQPSGWESQVILFLLGMAERLGEENPELIISETGLLYGTLTRRLIQVLPESGVVWGFCPDDELRAGLAEDAFFLDNLNACLKESPFLDHVYVRATDLVVVNSAQPDAWAELVLWVARGKPGSYLVVPRPSLAPTPALRMLLFHLKVPCRFLTNPAQTLVARHGEGIESWVSGIWSGIIERTP